MKVESDGYRDCIKTIAAGLVCFPTGIALHVGPWAGLAASGVELIVFGIFGAVMHGIKADGHD